MSIVITGTSGTWSHYTTGVVISVTGHGSKSPAAPVIWDDCSGTNPLDYWTAAWPDSGAGALLTYRTVAGAGRSVALPHTRGSKYLCGNVAGTGTGGGTGPATMVWHAFTKSEGMKLYTSFYNRADPSWVFDSFDQNYKWYDYSIGTAGYDAFNYYTQYVVGQLTNNTDTPTINMNDDSHSFINTPPLYREGDFLITEDVCGNGGSGWYQDNGNNPMAGWIKFDTQLMIGSTTGSCGTPNGFWSVWENNVQKVNYTGKTDAHSGTDRTIGIGGYKRANGAEIGAGPAANNWNYYKDLYVDHTLSRVILADSATYSSATITEPQIPSAWGGSSVTVKVNLGKLPDSGTAYLFVFDDTGAHNTTGFPITLGASSGGVASTTGVTPRMMLNLP